MKKIYIIAGLFLLASCETLLVPDPVGPERQIALQARLLTVDTLHTVHAVYSKYESLEEAKDLTIACYVNGECVAVTSESEAETAEYKTSVPWRSYKFKAEIHPGDSVRIEATGPTEWATASVKAPDAPPAPEVSMELIPSTFDSYYQHKYRFQIHVEDQPGKRNWYRLATLCRQVHNEYRVKSSYYYPVSEEGWFNILDRTIVIPVDNSMDSFLNPEERVVDKWNKDYLANEYNFFTDELFEDGAVDLTLEANVYHYTRIENASLGFYGEFSYRTIFYAYFDLQNLSREDYLNSRMLEMENLSLTGVGWVDDLFLQDIVFPDNVEGGIGFVTVRSVSRAVLKLGESSARDGLSFWPLE